MPAPKVQWTPLLRNQVLTLWREGKTASQIAAIMGDEFTHNMILGQLYHHGHMRTGKGSEGVPRRKGTGQRQVRASYPDVEVYKVHPMWGMEEDERRRMIINRAAKGARQAIMESMQ